MSTINREMMVITADTPEVKGMHDVHGRMCNQALFEMLGQGPKDGCHEIIAAAVAPYGLLPEDIPDTMDLFMNYRHDCASRRWVLEEGCSRPRRLHRVRGADGLPRRAIQLPVLPRRPDRGRNPPLTRPARFHRRAISRCRPSSGAMVSGGRRPKPHSVAMPNPETSFVARSSRRFAPATPSVMCTRPR